MPDSKSEIGNRKSEISLIAAMGENRVIGCDNALPWHLPADLKHFKRLTAGHTVVMGRKTYESVGKPLPNRRNVVVTRNADWRAEGVEVAHSLEEAMRLAAGDGGVFIVGGERLFRTALPTADHIYLTRVHGNFEGDVFFPEFEGRDWALKERVEHPADAKHAYAMSFETYDRVKP